MVVNIINWLVAKRMETCRNLRLISRFRLAYNKDLFHMRRVQIKNINHYETLLVIKTLNTTHHIGVPSLIFSISAAGYRYKHFYHFLGNCTYSLVKKKKKRKVFQLRLRLRNISLVDLFCIFFSSFYICLFFKSLTNYIAYKAVILSLFCHYNCFPLE